MGIAPKQSKTTMLPYLRFFLVLRKQFLEWNERPHDAGSPAGLAVRPLDGVVRADPPPVGGWEPRVRQGLGAAIADGLRGPLEPHGLQLVGDLGGLPLRRLARLHGVNRLGHRGDLRAPRLRRPRQHVPVEADGAALASGAPGTPRRSSRPSRRPCRR